MYASPDGLFVPNLVFRAAHQFGERTAVIDTSYDPPLRIGYADYAARVRSIARSLAATGVRPGEVVAIFLANSWEFCVAFHAIQLIGAVPTPLNPAYRKREVLFQLESSKAVVLITDGTLIHDIPLGGALRRIYTTRTPAGGAEPFLTLLRPSTTKLPVPDTDPRLALAALPFSSGTTGMPKGVMLTHHNLVANVYQTLGNATSPIFTRDDVALCFLPLYHIYGLNVVLNPVLTVGGTLVLMPRFDTERAIRHISGLGITCMPSVPPVLNAFCAAAEKGLFPADHKLRWVKSGAAPLPAELARRFPDLTGIPIRQGYGMTEASPVTHIGFLEPEFYQPTSIGLPVAQTECRVLNEEGEDVAAGEIGELVMRGPQFMLGYWNAPEATDAVMREGWYFSGTWCVATKTASISSSIAARR